MKTHNTLKFSVLVENTAQSENQGNTVTRKPLQAVLSNVNNAAKLPGKKTINKDHVKPSNQKINGPQDTREMVHEQTQTKAAIMVDKEVQLTLNQITAADLTSETPGEKYWEIVAEQRRVALEQALAANKALHRRLEMLEKQCQLKDAMLDEARAMADVLQELLNENDAV